MARTLKYDCPECGTDTGNHKFRCELSEFDGQDIERAYIDIISPLTDMRHQDLTKSDLAAIADGVPNGGWSLCHEKVLSNLLECGRVSLDNGRYKLPERSGGGRYIDDSTPKEKVAEALNEIDPDVDNGTWVKLAFTVCDWDDGEVGKKIFKEWSRTGKKWDAEADMRIDNMWSSYTDGDDNPSVATLVYFAKKHGW